MNRETTLKELFQQFQTVIEKIDGIGYITESMKRIVETPVISYTSDDTSIVLGELFTVISPGFYKVLTKGSGKGSYTVKNSNSQKTIYSGKLQDNDESGILSLTAGDLCYFHASSASEHSIQITLVQTHSLFDVITEYLRDSTLAQFSLNARIDNIIATAGEQKELPTELVDMRTDYWGNTYTTADARLRNVEEKVDSMEAMAFPKFIGDDEEWDEGNEYDAFTFIHDGDGNSYVSAHPVPAGVKLSDRYYWIPWDVRDTQTQILSNRIEQLNNALAGIDARVKELEKQ